MNKYFISTAIPYVNSDPHIGFALELIQADVLARFHRLKNEDVFFITGTDENALKNAQAAEKAGEEVGEFVAKHAKKFKDLLDVLSISNNDFIRTTEERHIKGAQKLWKACKPEDIYKKGYKGLYCVGCEEFKTPKDLIDGNCPEHKTKPEEIEEENYFFKLSRYQKQILNLIESGELKITPANRKNELVEFIKEGLEDFSISRSRQRAKNWGITVPGDDSQIMYVWFDALTNYINALGYGEDDMRFKEYWKEGYTAHLVGKGITRFHTIYWPAMLLSAGLPLPKEVFVHGYVTSDGEKMSKSLGNVVDPFKVVEKYGADVVRYFLLREIPSGEDGDFSLKKLEDRYNGDLANGLGNLVSRVATLVENGLGGEINIIDGLLVKETKDVAYETHGKVTVAMENFKLHEALVSIWSLIKYANTYFNNEKPWETLKTNPENFNRTMINTVFLLNSISIFLKPFMPITAEKIPHFDGVVLSDSKKIPHKLSISKGEPLFPRLK